MKLNGNHVIFSKQPDGRRMHIFEVFHSPSGGKKDDFTSCGYVEVPIEDFDSGQAELQWWRENKPTVGAYSTAPVSTSITKQFTKDWKLVVDLPDFNGR
jgi:hypothetical protein